MGKILVLAFASGLSVRAGTTLLYSAESRDHREAQWRQVAERFEAVARKNLDGWNECLKIAKGLQ